MPTSHLNMVSDDKGAPKFGFTVVPTSTTETETEFGDQARLSEHDRTTSNNTFTLDSPPLSPRNFHSYSNSRNSNSLLDNGDFLRWPSAYGSGYGTPDGLSPRRETFSSPRLRPTTMFSTVQSSLKIERDRQKSTMLTPDTVIPKPWLETRDSYVKISYFATYMTVILGLLLGGVRLYLGWKDVHLMPGKLCMVMDENFNSDTGIFGDNGKFFREVEMSGFGNGQFEMTTSEEKNSYVKNGHLYITPTLTVDSIGDAALMDGHVYNLTGCTYNITQGISYTSSHPVANSSTDLADKAYLKACSARSNVTSGQIINPVQSARLSTRKTHSIKYGKVEVRAKLPTGDWLWPAIWMLPVEDKYGSWPMSGEIDIMEARGNGPSYPNQGADYVRSSLNWGPLSWLNAGWKTFGWWSLRRGGYDQSFHTYSLEWDQDIIRMYVDTRLHHMLDMKIKKPFFELGEFPTVVQNATDTLILENPWKNGTKAAPFDQSFYLILNVAVGGTNGWFPDGPEKPWLDGSNTPMLDFWRARSKWGQTWPNNAEDRSLVIDYVKMWQKC